MHHRGPRDQTYGLIKPLGQDENIDQAVSHLFRQESGKMVAVLVKIFGTENLELAEDVMQDALVRALETWKFHGIPDNPRAWLYRTAKNKAIDVIRRNKHSQTIDFSAPERQLLTSEYTLATTVGNYWQDDHIKDDFLAMMYACCHPELSPENQITLILKSLCGFSTKEVAKAFLTTEDAVSKRLYRTKEYFRKNKTRPEIPSAGELGSRTTSVLNAIYLMFNEGFNSTHSDQLIREDLIHQAMMLCKSLLENKRTELAQGYALMALMCFHSARTDSRLTPEGELILLAQQNREEWNRDLITLGNQYLNKAAFGDKISAYHLEAAIAYEHCVAKNYESTNWKRILGYYDALLSNSDDPIVFMNRCLVILQLNGPESALKNLNTVKDNKQLQKYYLFHASLGEIQTRLGRKTEAAQSFQKALKLTQSNQEKRFLRDKIAASSN